MGVDTMTVMIVLVRMVGLSVPNLIMCVFHIPNPYPFSALVSL